MKNIQTTPRNIPGEIETREFLAPHLLSIGECIKDGWRAWEAFGEKAPELRAPLSPIARANFVYCHIVQAAKRRFQDILNVHLSEKAGFLAVIFENKVVVRFKKLNERGKFSLSKTRQSELFMAQLGIPGIGDAPTKLIGGYMLDQLQVAILDVRLICPRSRDIEWSMSIPAQVPTTLSSDACNTIELKPVVRSNRVAKKDKQA